MKARLTDEKLIYGDSWRPEDKAMKSAEEEYVARHAKSLQAESTEVIDSSGDGVTESSYDEKP